MESTLITVRHNVEMAHRLTLTPGKCEAIHGHSWWVDLSLEGIVDDTGMLCGLDFGKVKHAFREMLDEEYDHRVLLNESDPFAAPLTIVCRPHQIPQKVSLPGLQVLPGDPTTENFALMIGSWARSMFVREGITGISVVVHETSVNSGSWRWTND